MQELSYLSAVLAMKRMQSPEKSIEMLNKAMETHFAGIKVSRFKCFGFSYDIDYHSDPVSIAQGL